MYQNVSYKMEAVEGTDIEIPSGCAGAIILSLDHYEAVGDHYLYICRVEAVYADPSIKALFAYDGYGRIATADELRVEREKAGIPLSFFVLRLANDCYNHRERKEKA